MNQLSLHLHLVLMQYGQRLLQSYAFCSYLNLFPHLDRASHHRLEHVHIHLSLTAQILWHVFLFFQQSLELKFAYVYAQDIDTSDQPSVQLIVPEFQPHVQDTQASLFEQIINVSNRKFQLQFQPLNVDYD